MAYGYAVRKADDNQKNIAEAFRRLGFSVQHLHTVGKGCPDLLVGRCKVNYLIEIKDGSKSKSKRELTDDEQKFFDSWKGQVTVIETINDVIEFSKQVK